MSSGFSMRLGAAKGAAAPSFSSASSALLRPDDDEQETARGPEAITAIEGSELHTEHGPAPVPGKLVIPLQRVNHWATEAGKANTAAAPAPPAEAAAAAASAASASAAAAPPADETLDQRAVRELLADAARFGGAGGEDRPSQLEAIPLLLQNRVPGYDKAMGEDELYRIDVALRPEQSSLKDYEKTPVEQFGEAMLRGMGWKEGEAIGGVNKGLVTPVMFRPLPPKLGLGANEEDALKRQEERRKPKQYIKPGETREPATVMVPEDGGSKHVMSIDTKLVAKETLELKPGAYVEVTAAPHTGKLGRVHALKGLSDLEVRLTVSDAIIRLREHDVRLLYKQQ